MQYEKLQNPPIKEMVLSMRLKGLAEHERLLAFLNDDFIIDSYIIPNLVGKPESWLKKIRKGFRSKVDPNKILKITLDSVSYHQLGYISFEVLYKEFSEIWNRFQLHSNISIVDGIVLRYINFIDTTFPNFDVRDFTKVYIHNELEVVNRNFFLQILVAKKDRRDIKGAITQTISNQGNKVGLILDISVNITSEIPGLSSDLEVLKHDLFEMRDFKNYLFFNTLSDNVLKGFNQVF